MRDQLTEEMFLKSVSEHVMTVEKDDGLYRHLKFDKPKTVNMHFRVTTWPGYLCISGDMGCYVFSRIPDMLEFFRSDNHTKAGLYINEDYWSQKVEAIDRNSPIKEYSEDKFKKRVAEWCDDFEADAGLRDAVEEEVLSMAGEGHHEAVKAAMDFEHKGRYPFQDFYECNVKEYSYHFIWCLYAIAWAVKQYDSRSRATTDPKEGVTT